MEDGKGRGEKKHRVSCTLAFQNEESRDSIIVGTRNKNVNTLLKVNIDQYERHQKEELKNAERR